MKYNIFPTNKPQINELVYWLNPQCKEVLGYFQGFSYNFPIFIDGDKKMSSFHPKYWRKTNDEDKLLIQWSPEQVESPSRKRKKK